MSVAVVVLFDRFMSTSEVPLSAFAIFWALALLYAIGSRFFVRYLFARTLNGKSALRVAIYGAGMPVRACRPYCWADRTLEPVAFVDDKKSLQGSSINGLNRIRAGRVAADGPPATDRPDPAAMPSASRRRRREILTALEPLGLARSITAAPDGSDRPAKARIDELRDVDVGDLLGRDPVPPNPRLFSSCIRGKCVLVTGAGGSIGCGAVPADHATVPSRLVLFEMSEIALYTIERELNEIAARDHLTVESCSAARQCAPPPAVREVLAAYGVQTIYHAARLQTCADRRAQCGRRRPQQRNQARGTRLKLRSRRAWRLSS